ncbi:GNAT family N-acetyltransferase [Azohydromonas australica]|uniref:GNAT family N-acetyltransferase n=1 Tax=Azohydromonas australica TaxID=364039 RepID=UPI0005BE5DEF|nr:GNAT family N-acetyltransferase [Azohydromonas australica]
MDSDVKYGWISGADACDGREIVALINEAVADEGTLGYAAPMTEAEADAYVKALDIRVASGDCHVFLVRVGGEPAFMAQLSISGMPNCRHRAEISKGVAARRFRGRGLVDLAFREIVKRSETLGVEQLVLDVREGTRAHRLWQRYGFQTYGVLEDYARFGGVSHRGHFMVQTTASLRARVFPQG